MSFPGYSISWKHRLSALLQLNKSKCRDLRKKKRKKKQQSQDAAKDTLITHMENIIKQRLVNQALQHCPEGLQDLHPWRFPNSALLNPWAPWSNHALSPTIRRLNQMTSRGPFYPRFFYKSLILWRCYLSQKGSSTTKPFRKSELK